jgi:hypothetical protein
VSGELHAPAALPRGSNPQYPLGGGIQKRSGPYGEEKNLAPTRNCTSAVQFKAHRYTDSLRRLKALKWVLQNEQHLPSSTPFYSLAQYRTIAGAIGRIDCPSVPFDVSCMGYY